MNPKMPSFFRPLLNLHQKVNDFASGKPRLFAALLCLVLGAITWLTYSNSFTGGMVLDNAIVLQMDPRLQAPLDKDELKKGVPVALDKTWPFQWYNGEQREQEWIRDHNTGEKIKPKYALPLYFVKDEFRGQIERTFTENYWWPSFPTDLYRPITTLSYFFNYTVLGSKTDTFSYHVINLVLHWLCSCFVLLIARAIWPNRYGLSFLAAAIFALHPVAVESVTNIVGRADLISTLCILLAGYIYIRLTRILDSGNFAKIALTWLPCAIAFVVVSCIGVLAKESGIMLLGLIGLYDFFFRGESLPLLSKTRIKPGRFTWVALGETVLVFLAVWLVRWFVIMGGPKEELVWVLPLLLGIVGTGIALLWVNLEGEGKSNQSVRETFFSVLYRYALPGWLLMLPAIVLVFYAKKVILGNSPFYGQIFIDNPIVGAGAFDGLMTAIKVLGLYLGVLVYPSTLSCDYSFNQIPVFGDHTASFADNLLAWVALALIVVLFISVFHWRKRNPAFGFGVCMFFLMILPTSNIFFNIGSIMAERFLYLPLVGFAILAAIFVQAVTMAFNRFWERETGSVDVIVVLVPLVVLGAYGLRSYVRNFDWHNDVNLWRSAVEACPRSFKVHKGYAGALRIEAQPPIEWPRTAAQLDVSEQSFINSARLRAEKPLLSDLTQPEAEYINTERKRTQIPLYPANPNLSEQEKSQINAVRMQEKRSLLALDPTLTPAETNYVNSARRSVWRPLLSEDPNLTAAELSYVNNARASAGKPALSQDPNLSPEEIERVRAWRNRYEPDRPDGPSEEEIYFMDQERAKRGRRPYAEDNALDDVDKQIRAQWANVIAERGLDKALARVEEGIRVLDSGDLPDSKQDNTLFYDSGLYYNTKAQVLQERGDVQEALRYYQRAYEILWRGVRVDMHVNKTSKEAMRNRGIPEDDIIEVGNPKIRTQFVIAAARLGRLDKALESIIQTRKMVPMEADPASLHAILLKETGQEDLARATFMQALVLNGQHQQAWQGLAELYSKMPESQPPNQPPILQHESGALSLNNQSPIAMKDLQTAFILLEDLLWETKRFDEANAVRIKAMEDYGVPRTAFTKLRDPSKRTGGVAASGRGINVEIDTRGKKGAKPPQDGAAPATGTQALPPPAFPQPSPAQQ